MPKSISIFLGLLLSGHALAFEGYVFVSSSMPHSSLVSLAKEAGAKGFTMVLNGFGQANISYDKASLFAQEINRNCCQKNPPAWVIYPQLFAKFGVKTVPTFVVSVSGEQDRFSKISGDMGLGNALKFFGQESTIPAIREETKRIYYGTK